MKVQHLIDKSEWPDGPWKGEPDQLEWVDEHTGYECRIQRSQVSGALNGYVSVPYGHPSFGLKYDDVEADVHGGLTFAGHRHDSQAWWVGFDCAHAFDYAPAFDMRWVSVKRSDPHMAPQFREAQNYRDVKYVVEQCTVLAAQLKVMETIQ